MLERGRSGFGAALRFSAARDGDSGNVWALDAQGQASLLLDRRLRTAGPLRREFEVAVSRVLRLEERGGEDVDLSDAPRTCSGPASTRTRRWKCSTRPCATTWTTSVTSGRLAER